MKLSYKNQIIVMVRLRIVNKLCVIGGLILTISPAVSPAMPPPAQTKLCKVTGKVMSVSVAASTTPDLKPVEVSTVTLQINHVAASDIKESSFVDCKTIKVKSTQVFRNCGTYSFQKNQVIEGIVGRSIGGGPYCIDQVTLRDK